ncbi:hypothetical protein M3J09_001273 [Ascochyta lentis]
MDTHSLAPLYSISLIWETAPTRPRISDITHHKAQNQVTNSPLSIA